jgi:hypothetical protein
VGEVNIDYIAWWGAGLSTLLAFVKLWELWRDRFRIDIGYGFTGDPGMGNDIHIRNLAGKPIILGYWELFYRSNWWPLRKDSHIDSPGPDAHDVRIEGHSSKTINFSGIDHFDWGWKAMKGRRIYIRLHIAGRRPKVKKVYG